MGSQTQGTPAATPALHAAVRWVPFKDSYWFARVVFYRYLHASEQQPWNPDYAYSFGYEDWHPGAWSATYSNYTGTRWNPDALLRPSRLNFPQGLLATTYRFALPESMRSVFLAGDGDEAICTAGAELTPRYMDLASLTERGNRVAATLGCRYTRPDGWFAGVVAFVYPRRFQQQPWDPDFTYSFGLLNVRPGTWSVWYSNYSGNRFPGRSRAAAEGTPRSGIVTVSWRFD